MMIPFPYSEFMSLSQLGIAVTFGGLMLLIAVGCFVRSAELHKEERERYLTGGFVALAVSGLFFLLGWWMVIAALLWSLLMMWTYRP